MKKYFLGLLSILLFANAFANSKNMPHNAVKYKNERGSILMLVKHRTDKHSGMISGTFSSAVASKNCRQIINKPMPISGFYNGNAIAITVNFPSCKAVVAIVGNFKNKNRVSTLWLDAHQGKNWNTRLIGHDEFRRTS